MRGRRTKRCVTMLLLFAGIALAQKLQQSSSVAKDDAIPTRARAFAAPTGANAVDEISVDGKKKSFIKIGVVRDGVQKAIFDEADEVAPDVDNENRGRDFSFGLYDDNSVVDSRHEQPLWIPPFYRNETEEEKATTATTKLLPTATKATPAAPLLIRRPLIGQEISNQPSIPVRTMPPTTVATFTPFTVFGRQPFAPSAPSAPFRLAQFQLQQQQFLSQQQAQQFIPRQRPIHPEQQQFVPQQQKPFQSQQKQQFIQPPQVPQQQRQQFAFVSQQPQPQPQLQPQRRLFQPAQNNFINQQTRPPIGATENLRTGVCVNTIFYESAPAAPFDLHLTYSHFATVMSIDQCARTCHEFNCAHALFDRATRRCQFNPATVSSVPQGTCPSWPNPLYRNNVPITRQSLRIFCVTCQTRRRDGHRPVTFRTTSFNRFDQRSFSQNIANAALHGVTLERPPAAIDDKLLNENLEAFSAAPKDDKNISGGLSAPNAARTTIKPLSAKFTVNSLETSVESTATPYRLHRSKGNVSLQIPSSPPELRILLLRSRTTIDDATVHARRYRRTTSQTAPTSLGTVVAERTH